MASESTPADDLVYDLVSVQYHALKAAHTVDKYIEDAQGNDDIRQFFEQIKAQDAERATKCHDFLAQVAKGGIG